MSRVSPTLEGFRACLRRPSLTFTEIAWRWTAGAAGWAFVLFWFIEYPQTLPVSNGDARLLWTRQPWLAGQAITHILRGSRNRAVLAAVVAVLAFSALWVVAARDRDDTLSALGAAVTFSRERLGPVFAVSAWTGAHLIAFSVATTAVSMPLAFIQMASARHIVGAIIFLTLIYFAVADCLYMVRLAGYVCIAEMPDALGSSDRLPALPQQTSIDRDERILSDIPNLA
jgi:hypothetical protein